MLSAVDLRVLVLHALDVVLLLLVLGVLLAADGQSSLLEAFVRLRVHVVRGFACYGPREPLSQVCMHVGQRPRKPLQSFDDSLALMDDCRESSSFPLDHLNAHRLHAEQLSFACSDAGSRLGRGCRAPVLVGTSEQPEEVVDLVRAAEVLREQVRRILFATYFEELQRLVSHPLLYPQALGIDVAQAAQTLPATDPNGCGAIRPYSDRKLVAEIGEQGLESQGDSTRFYDSVKLGFPTAEGN